MKGSRIVLEWVDSQMYRAVLEWPRAGHRIVAGIIFPFREICDTPVVRHFIRQPGSAAPENDWIPGVVRLAAQIRWIELAGSDDVESLSEEFVRIPAGT